MAYLQATVVDYTYAQVNIKGLEYIYSKYDSFRYSNETTGQTFYFNYDYYHFSNLSEGTTYNISAEACYEGTWYSCGSISFTTLYHVVPSVPSYAPVLVSRGKGTLSVQWGTTDDATEYYYLKYRNYAGSTEYNMMSNTSYTISGLEYGVTYYLSVRAKNIWKTSAYTEESTATTAPKTPSISLGSIVNNSVTINITGMSGNYDYIRVFCYDSNWNVVSSQDGSNNGSVTFTGLAQGTYYFQAWSYFSVNGTTLQSVNYGQVNATVNVRPSNWSWSYTIQSGGNVYNTAVSGNSIIAYIMTANEWDNFCSKINEYRRYKGLGNYTFTGVSSGQNCTPAIINEAVNAINDMGFSVATISAGNISASVFINMRDSLNSIT